MMHTIFIYFMHVIREIPQIVPKLYIIVKYFGCVNPALRTESTKDTFNSNFCDDFALFAISFLKLLNMQIFYPVLFYFLLETFAIAKTD